MKKKTILLIIISCIITLFPMFVGLFLWDKLPDTMATSFGFNGEINGYSSKLFAVVGLPVVLVACNIICVIFTMADPRRKNISPTMLIAVLAVIPLCAVFCGVLLYKDYFGIRINVENFAPVFLGIVFLGLGIVLPKCKQNYTVGIKIPWTLNSEDNWNKTHAFGGKLWVVGGIVVIILGLLGFEETVFATILAMAIIPIGYSYLYYRKNERK